MFRGSGCRRCELRGPEQFPQKDRLCRGKRTPLPAVRRNVVSPLERSAGRAVLCVFADLQRYSVGEECSGHECVYGTVTCPCLIAGADCAAGPAHVARRSWMTPARQLESRSTLHFSHEITPLAAPRLRSPMNTLTVIGHNGNTSARNTRQANGQLTCKSLEQ